VAKQLDQRSNPKIQTNSHQEPFSNKRKKNSHQDPIWQNQYKTQ